MSAGLLGGFLCCDDTGTGESGRAHGQHTDRGDSVTSLTVEVYGNDRQKKVSFPTFLSLRPLFAADDTDAVTFLYLGPRRGVRGITQICSQSYFVLFHVNT